MAGPKTFSALVEHYRLKELPKDNHERKTKKTKKVYESNLKNHIVPRWGGYQLRDFSSVEIEEWLGCLKLAPGSRAKIRNQMSAIFRHGIRWGWIGQQENPIAMVRVSGKRQRTPETLTAQEFMALFGPACATRLEGAPLGGRTNPLLAQPLSQIAGQLRKDQIGRASCRERVYGRV